MMDLISIELTKIFKKWRTYIGFIAIGLLTPVVQIALYYEGNHYIEFFTQSLQNSFYMSGNLLNGYFVGYLILQALIIHIPFLIVLVGGDLLAGEATMGTYRMLLTRPVSRFQVLTSKFIVGLIYTALLVMWLAFVSLIVSIVIFGTGELIVIKSAITILSSNDVLWRFALAYLFAVLSLSAVFALSFLFSALVENAIGPIVAAMAVIIIFLIVSAIPVSALEAARPFLFTNYMNAWRSFFDNPVSYTDIFNSVGVLLLHTVGFYSITLFIFLKKDILS